MRSWPRAPTRAGPPRRPPPPTARSTGRGCSSPTTASRCGCGSGGEIPSRLDGTGHRVAALVDEIRAGIDDAAAPLAEAQAREVAEVNERIERYGQRGSGVRDLEARHRRAQRRLRTDELRLGFEELADRYRSELASTADPAALVEGLQALQRAIEALIRNPSEELLLQSLLLQLPRLG